MTVYWPRSFFCCVFKDLIYVAQTRRLAISQPGHIYRYASQTEETTTSSELGEGLKESQLTGGTVVGFLQRATWGVDSGWRS